MEGSRPHVLWLRADHFCNGPVWATVDLSPESTVFLMRGWKLFARSRGLGPGHLLHFRFDVSATLSVKFFGSTAVCLVCCTESLSDCDSDSTSNSNDDRSVLGVKMKCNESK
ncbi:heat shock cognate 70 kda protein 1 [Hordeum vulgare]|nr:heat shock cognate 70 kda protein 1 [Hordeum vulgare]